VRGLFVTGTDTGVGKTEVACALLGGARAAGLDVGAMKPAQSGLVPGEPSDAERLRDAAGGTDPMELVCPYQFGPPLAPGVAARLGGVEISLARLLEAARALAARHAALLWRGRAACWSRSPRRGPTPISPWPSACRCWWWRGPGWAP
jgi:dethiobiotin synthetase